MNNGTFASTCFDKVANKLSRSYIGNLKFLDILGRFSHLSFARTYLGILHMQVTVSCPTCARSLKVAETSLGKKGKCPGCQTVFVMEATSPTQSAPPSLAPVSTPAPVSKISVQCSCGANLKVAETLQGKKIQCPKCRQALAIPLPEASQPASNPAGDDLWGGLDLPVSTAAPQFPTGGNFADAYTYKPSPGEKKRSKNKAVAPTGDAAERIAEASLAMETARTSYSSSFGFEWSWLNIRLFILFIGAIFASPFVLVAGCKEQRKQTLLAQDAGTTQGIITEAYESRSRRGYRSYSVDVAYTVDEKPYEINLSVDSTFFATHVQNGARNGEQVEIKYAKADPSLAEIEGSSSNSYAGIGFGLSLFVFGVGGLCYLFFLASD